MDNFLARFNFKPMDDLKLGVFGLYEQADPQASASNITSEDYQVKRFAGNSDFRLFHVGVDGSYSMPLADGKLFFNWDVIYQTGEFDDATFTDTATGDGATEDFDLSAWFLHLDAGYSWDDFKVTYTFWYASGDDDPDDDEFNGFLTIDLDRADNIIFFEGVYTDDDYFSERQHILDRGFIMNKLALDYQATEKLTLGGAFMFMFTAEDIEYTDNDGDSQEENYLGFEIDGFLKYQLYKNLEFALNAGYLFSGDAMDFYEVGDIRDGSADENIFISTARLRYKF